MRNTKDISNALAVLRLVLGQVRQKPRPDWADGLSKLEKLNEEVRLAREEERLEYQIKMLEWVRGDVNEFDDLIEAWKRAKGWE